MMNGSLFSETRDEKMAMVLAGGGVAQVTVAMETDMMSRCCSPVNSPSGNPPESWHTACAQPAFF